MKKGVSAWLILWDSPNKAEIPENYIAAILNPRLNWKKVAKITELLYANMWYTPSERIRVATKRWNPYKAQYWNRGIITCGHNPYLEAFIVDDLRTEEMNDEEKITYKRRQYPEPSKKL